MKASFVFAAIFAVLAGGAFAGENKSGAPEYFRGQGVAMGPVSAIDKVKNEIIIGNDIIKVSPADIARLKVGDDVTVTVRKGKTTVRKADEKKGPQPFEGNGVALGPISAIDQARNEITLGDNIIKLKPEDIARLKVGDDVTVNVRKGKATVKKAGEPAELERFEGSSGVATGPISAIDAAKNEIILGKSIIKLSAKEIAGLKVGDDVTVRLKNNKCTLEKSAAR